MAVFPWTEIDGQHSGERRQFVAVKFMGAPALVDLMREDMAGTEGAAGVAAGQHDIETGGRFG